MIPTANPMTAFAREAMTMGKESGPEGKAFKTMAMVGMGCMIGVSVLHGVSQGLKVVFGSPHDRHQNDEIEKLWREVERLKERHGARER